MRQIAPAALSVLLAIAAVAAPPDDLQATLAEMEAAVLAGDADAYLRHVCPDDPVFFQEQKNWAADLKLHVPTAFDLEILEPAPADAGADRAAAAAESMEQSDASVAAPVYTDTRAVVELRTTWTLGPETTGAEPVERTLSFPVVFIKRDAGDQRWLYAGEEWVVIEEGQNLVMCPAGFEPAAEQVAEELPEVREHVDGLFGRRIDRVQEVKIYSSMLHLQHSIYLSYLDGLGGWNEPGESIKILARPGLRRSLKPLLAHEYGHVATFELGEASNDMPWWLLEGVAEFSGAAFANFREHSNRFVTQRHQEGSLAEWPALADFRNIDPELVGHVYRQGHHMVEFIAERYSREKMIQWLEAMARGATLEDASIDALGEPFEVIDAQWRSRVAQQAAAQQADQPAVKATEIPDEQP